MYIYPDNLKSKAVLWLWQLRDIGVIGIGCLISVFALAQLGFLLLIVATALYAFLTIRFDDTSILTLSAPAPFPTAQQFYEWRLQSGDHWEPNARVGK